MEEKEDEEKDKYWQQTDIYRKHADLSEEMKARPQ